MNNKRTVTSILLIASLVLLAGCMPGTGASTAAQPASFFHGIWHGWLAPFSLIGHFFFDNNIRIYEIHNVGIWYDVGFYMAVISGFGGISLFRRKKK